MQKCQSTFCIILLSFLPQSVYPSIAAISSGKPLHIFRCTNREPMADPFPHLFTSDQPDLPPPPSPLPSDDSTCFFWSSSPLPSPLSAKSLVAISDRPAPSKTKTQTHIGLPSASHNQPTTRPAVVAMADSPICGRRFLALLLLSCLGHFSCPCEYENELFILESGNAWESEVKTLMEEKSSWAE